MANRPRASLAHVGLYVRNFDKMVDFYTKVLGLTVTDQGEVGPAAAKIIFMSSDPNEHHQFVLIDGRPDDVSFNVAQQISFLVEGLDDLRIIHDLIAASGLEIQRTVTHGNAWSVYCNDPDDNRIEIYAHTPWYVPQPHAHPIDMSLSKDEIMKQTEAHCRASPGFKSSAEREKEMTKLLALPG